jgi:F-type H+-transporting ATPase subunit b
MQLQPDFSLFVQIVFFIVLWMGLKRLLFEPVLQILDARHERTVGTLKRAAEVRLSAEAAREDCGRSVQEARQKLAREADEARKAAQDEHAKVLASARADAGAEIARFRESLAGQVDQARAALGVEAQAIAGQMLDRVTGRA